MNETKYDLYEKIARLQWLMRRDHMQNHARRGPTADASRGQGRVLALLKLQPEIATKDLAYLLGIRQQSLNELLNKLEKGGYIERIPSEADRRVMLARLTDKGREEPQEEDGRIDMFACLNEEEQAALAGYLDRIIAAMEERLGDEDDDERAAWMQTARDRMGDERFEMLMGQRGGFHGRGRGWDGMDGRGRGMDGRDGNDPDGRFHGRDCHDGRGGRGPDGRGDCPRGDMRRRHGGWDGPYDERG